jgi:signal transduction histidine kinase
MFFRLSAKVDGTGIGLYIVKEILEKMHGTIQVHSEEGKGTVFNIKIKNLRP